MIDLLRHELRVRRGSFIGWALGLAFFCSIYTLIYPNLPAEVREIDPRALALLESIGIQTFATYEGFILGTLFNFLPLLVGLFGVVVGAGALGGEEDDGTLELLAALPVSRVQLVLVKTLALAIGAALVILFDGLVAAGVFSLLGLDTPVTALDMFLTVQSMWVMAFVFLAIGLFLGAYLPNHGVALGVALAALFTSFFGDNLAGMAPVLEPLQPFLPHCHYESVIHMLTGDVAWREIGILVAIGVGFVLLAVLSFQRRNLTVGVWPWQRPRVAG